MDTPNLVGAVEAALYADREADEPRRELHSSDLVHSSREDGCPRQLWLRLQGAEERPASPGELFMWAQGHALERRIVDYLSEWLPRIAPPWRVDLRSKCLDGMSPDGIAGTLDFTIANDETGEVLVADVKTARGRAFNYIDKPVSDGGGPKHGAVLQVRHYARTIDAGGEALFYADREGQNGARHFFLERDDEQVERAVEAIKAIADLRDAPDVLEPKVDVRQNKGPDSIYVSMPWQCDYCRFRDVSCPGALAREQRGSGIAAKMDSGGSLKVLRPEVDDVLQRWLVGSGSQSSDLPY